MATAFTVSVQSTPETPDGPVEGASCSVTEWLTDQPPGFGVVHRNDAEAGLDVVDIEELRVTCLDPRPCWRQRS